MRSVFVVSCCVVLCLQGCGLLPDFGAYKDEPEEMEGEGEGRGEPQGSGVRAQLSLTSLDPDTVRAADGGDGAVLITGMDATYNVFVARLNAALDVEWVTELSAFYAPPTALLRDAKGRVVLTAVQTGTPLRIVRLDAETGAVHDAVSVQGATTGHVLSEPDGGLLLAAGGRLNDDLSLDWAGEGRGERVARASDGGYLYANATELAFGGTTTGVMIYKTDGRGEVQWRAVQTPGPGVQEIIGVRSFTDGTILAAMSNDSARSDNTASGNPLVVMRFDGTGESLEARAVDLDLPDSRGEYHGLGYGGAIDMVSDGDQTYLSLVANSGRLGADARGQVLTRHDRSGQVTGGLSQSGGVAVLSGGALALYNFSGALLVTPSLTPKCEGAGPLRYGERLIETRSELLKREALTGVLNRAMLVVEPFTPTLQSSGVTHTSEVVCDEGTP